jgi:NAD(P)H-hydrate epimerase
MTSAGDYTPLPTLPPRGPDSHKGDYGRALLIGGSQGMAGAVALAGMACLRSGAGLVTLATAAQAQATAASFEPSAMTLGLPADEHGRISKKAREAIVSAAEGVTALALGPGIGRTDELVELVSWLYQHTAQPMVVDADALWALAQNKAALAKSGGPRVLTPHPGEFARLLGVKKIAAGERESLAHDFAVKAGVVLVLKGHRTVITDGEHTHLNETGNPGMATGGTGDVLTGIITALLCQGLAPLDAARLGVHVHGLAGDLAAADLGQTATISSDLVRYLPHAWKQMEAP